MNRTLHAPPFVNYTCQTCGWCCRQYDITFSEADYERLSKHDWGKLIPELAGREWSAPLNERRNPDKHRLRYTPEGACVFLSRENLCLMHSRMGELGKSLGCCVYPFTFAATPSGVYVGLRFSCRSVAYGQGEPVVRQRETLQKKLALCESAGHLPVYPDVVNFDAHTMLAWSDYLALEEALIRITLRDDLPLPRRLLAIHKLLEVLQQAKLDSVRGEKFRQLLSILEAGMVGEAETDPLPAAPGMLWRMMYRQFLFVFQRRQGGAYRELSFLGQMKVRLRNFITGVQFAFNTGAPKLPGMPGRASLRRVARMARMPLDEAEEMAISRFLAAKLFGKQHFGRLFYGYTLLQGMGFWMLAAGAVMWYARARAVARGAERPEQEDVAEAIRYVDYCYGYSKAPSLPMERARIAILVRDDKAARLALNEFAR